MTDLRRLQDIIYAFWENRKDKAHFIEFMEGNGFMTRTDPKPKSDGTRHCTCGAGRAIGEHIVSLEAMRDDFTAAINFALDEAESEGIGEGILFLRLWREGDWEAIDNEFSEFKISDRLRNAQL